MSNDQKKKLQFCNVCRKEGTGRDPLREYCPENEDPEDDECIRLTCTKCWRGNYHDALTRLDKIKADEEKSKLCNVCLKEGTNEKPLNARPCDFCMKLSHDECRHEYYAAHEGRMFFCRDCWITRQDEMPRSMANYLFDNRGKIEAEKSKLCNVCLKEGTDHNPYDPLNPLPCDLCQGYSHTGCRQQYYTATEGMWLICKNCRLHRYKELPPSLWSAHFGPGRGVLYFDSNEQWHYS
jgi:hypothetical protein